MASYTSFLNLEKPTTSERLDVLKINSNWDKIDAGVSALNSQMAKGAFLSWGTSLTANNFHHGLLLLGRVIFVVWFASSADINVKGLTTPQFSKSGQNSVTFGDTSDTGTDYTVTRNGTTITVTTNGNATISLLYV